MHFFEIGFIFTFSKITKNRPNLDPCSALLCFFSGRKNGRDPSRSGYIPLNKEQIDLLHNIRLHVLTRFICLFHLGLTSLSFPNSLVKLTATRNIFLHNPRELQRAALPCWFEPAKQFLLQIFAKKQSPAKKRRGRDARMIFCLIYFFGPFPYITSRIIMSFGKPCHMPFCERIPPFTLSEFCLSTPSINRTRNDFRGNHNTSENHS